jgi:hypothetical protein
VLKRANLLQLLTHSATTNKNKQTQPPCIINEVVNRISAQQEADNARLAETEAKQQMQQHIANMTNSTQQNQSILNQMHTLMSTISTLQTQAANNATPTANNNDRNNRSNRHNNRSNDRNYTRSNDCNRHHRDNRNDNRNGGRNDQGGRGSSRRANKYCWSHGNCAHPGTECTSKAPGHIDAASYANMQGGSTYNCHWLE